MVDEMLHWVVLVEQVGIKGTDHVGTHRADHTVNDEAIFALRRGASVRLRPRPIGIVVAANHMNVGICPLSTGMVSH